MGFPGSLSHHQLPFCVHKAVFSRPKARPLSRLSGKHNAFVQEEAYLSKFDGVIVFSEDDKRALAELLEDEKVYVSPFGGLECKSASPAKQVEASFTFLGSEDTFSES